MGYAYRKQDADSNQNNSEILNQAEKLEQLKNLWAMEMGILAKANAKKLLKNILLKIRLSWIFMQLQVMKIYLLKKEICLLVKGSLL